MVPFLIKNRPYLYVNHNRGCPVCSFYVSLKNVVKETILQIIKFIILYKIDKARDSNDMLNGLRELSKRVLGLEDKEREKIYSPALESLVETLEKNKDNRELFEDIKNVLVTFSCVEISKIKRRRSQYE